MHTVIVKGPDVQIVENVTYAPTKLLFYGINSSSITLFIKKGIHF